MRKQDILLCVAYIFFGNFSTLAFAQQVDETIVLSAEFRKLGRVDSKEIDESSGLAASIANPGFYWTHNDGEDTRLFLLDQQGSVHAILKPREVEAYDIEDVCCCKLEGRNFILLGDVGDNKENQERRCVFFIPEPKIEFVKGKIVSQKSEPVIAIHFRYPDGSHNCESIAFDSQEDHIWLATKKFRAGSAVAPDRRPKFYRLKVNLEANAQETRLAIAVADLIDPLVTGMDFSADNLQLVTRTYGYARRYTRSEDQTWVEAVSNNAPAIFRLPVQKQGEAICFCGTNKVLVTSEAKQQPVWAVEFKEESKQ